MQYALIESADSTPIGGKAFPHTPQGLDQAIAHGTEVAAENSTVTPELVAADLRKCGVFEEGGWEIRIITIT
jgi:hypothetical protein